MLAILVLITSIIFIYVKVIKPYSTWSARGIKQTNPIYLLGDNAGTILGQRSFYDMIKNLYNSFPSERYFGMFQMTLPTLMIRDPDIIKTLTIKDFDHFVNHRVFFPDDVEPMWSKNLVSMKDNEWKQMRMILTPTFTSTKMRSIFNLISDCCDVYVKHFQKGNVTKSVELKEIAVRYTNDLIASVAFGIKCDSINDKNNEFFSMATSINAVSSRRLLGFFAYSLFPSLCKSIKLPVFPRKTTSFFTNIVKETIRARQKQDILRPDMINQLMGTRNENNLSDEDIAAQAFIFYLGGFESVSAIIYFMGHALATHPEVQVKLQEEISQTIKECKGKLTYEALLKMKYLDMVVSETLRKWPSLPILDRVCTKAYTMPSSSDTGKAIQLVPGEAILFPVVALHYDPKYFPDPEKFDPERFNDENKGNINPYVYMPFGSGPRNCIGSRLALLEIKMFYFYFLLKFDFLPTEKTENPLKLNKRSFSMTTQGDVWVALKPRVQ